MQLLIPILTFIFPLACLNALVQTEPEIHRIGLTGQTALLGYYNSSPESPDGTRIAYVVQSNVAKKPDAGGPMSGSLWVCDRNLTNHRKLLELQGVNAHNGVNTLWINDEWIAVNPDGKVLIIEAATGTILHGPYEGGLGHNAFDNHILINVDKNTAYGPSGIYEINTESGAMRLLRSNISHAAFQSDFPEGYNPNPETWKSLHLQYSPSGKRISYRFDCAHKSLVGRERQELFKLLITMQRDGSDPIIFGPKPMHFSWFDDTSIAGHDNQIEDGLPNDKSVRRWNLRGKYMETLAGYGNHLAISPDQQYFATESWYGAVPVILRVYRRSETEPFMQWVVSRDRRTTWELRYHVNASFSRDGLRVYFNHSPSPGVIEASFVDIGRAE